MGIIYYIYVYTFPNGKSYIGKSVDPERRFLEHITSLSLVGKAFRKYINEQIDFDILDQSEGEEQAYLLEQFYIEKLKTLYPVGYNLSVGGRGGQNGIKRSRETVEKIRQTSIGRKHTQESIKKMRNAKVGKGRSEETKEKLRETHTGMEHSEKTKKKIGDSLRGRKHTQEHIENQRESRRRNKVKKIT